MADPQTLQQQTVTQQQQTVTQQQQDVDNGPAELSTANQPAGTTKVENGIAYDISGKPLGPANMGDGSAPKVDYKAIAAQMGGTPKVDYKAVAAQMGGSPSAPGKTAPQQTTDLLTYALAKGRGLLKGSSEYSVPDNAELAQAKNASDYIYNNILGKDTYTHNNLTYDQTPTSAAGKVWQRLWGWATQDEINKIPGLEPDRVEALRANGNDLLSRMLGPENAKDFRRFVEDGFSIPTQYGTVSSKALDPIANPEVYARAAAKSLTDFFSPGYYALGAFGKTAQGYQKAAQVAADAGDLAKAVQSLSKARLLAILSTGVNVPFAASQAHDLVENWERMNVPERVAAVAGILGASLNAHIGIQHMGGYSQVAHDAIADTKATAQDIAQSKAAQATKKAVGAMVTLGKAQTFEDAIQRGSALTGKKFRQQQANIRSASPELQAVALENPNAETPGQFADAIHNWLQQREQVLLQSSGGTKESDTPVSPTLENDVRQRLDRFFDENRGKYGNDEQVDAAKQQIISRLLLQSKAAGAPPSLRMPNAFETENIRQGLNQEIKPQLNGTPTTAAYKVAVQQTIPILREALDKFYNNNGVKNVKEFRAKEATMINVADRLEAAEKRAQEMGNGSIWSSLVKKFSVPTIITSIALGHNPLAFGALAPYLMGERAYQNYKNPGVNVRRALELAEPKAITDLDVQPPAGGPGVPPPAGPAPVVGPSGVAHVGPPIHPTKAGQAAADVAAATIAEPPTNHALNAQLATHFGEPLDHASLDDRIERVKNDAEAMRRSGVDIAKTNTGKMLGAINEHESEHAAKIEAEQQKAHEDAAKVVQELHDEFQKLQEENRKKGIGRPLRFEGGQQPQQAATAFALPYETTDEELPESKYGDKSYSAVNTRLHELGHLIWSHRMGMQPFDVLSAEHPEAEGAHALARTDISRLLNPDGSNNKEAFKANLGDLVSRFLAGAVAEDVHGGIPLDQNTSASTDVAQVKKVFDALEVPEADRKRITQQAVAQLREEFSKPEVAEIMNAFASKRKAGLSSEYHFDETQVHQLRQALDATKGEPDGTKKTGPGVDRTARQQGGGVGEKPVAGREGGNAPEAGRLNQAQAGLAERTTGSEDADAAIRNGGGVPAGFMNVPGHGDYRMFHDPETGSTLAFKPHEAITPQTVGKKLASSRAEFEAGESRKQGGHAGGGVASVEELNRPGRFVKIGRSGAPTDQGKTPDFNLGVGEAGYQVTAEGPKLVSGQETAATKRGAEAYHKEVFGKHQLQTAQAAEEGKKVLDKAIEHYGITDEPRKMGYILPDGRGLDFSDGQAVRTLDHGDVTEVMPTPRGENPRDRFVRETGAARFLQSSYGTEVVLPASGATPKMAETIARAIEQHPRGKKELTVDLLHTPEEFEKVADQAGARSTTGSATGDAEDVEGVQRVVRDAQKDALRRQLESTKLQPQQAATDEWKERIANTPWVENRHGRHQLNIKDASGYHIGELVHDGSPGDLYSRIRSSHIKMPWRNQGIAKEMYKSAIEDVRKMGVPEFRSDTTVSNDAQNVWRSLAREGYPVHVAYTGQTNANGAGGMEYMIPLQGQKVTDADFHPLLELQPHQNAPAPAVAEGADKYNEKFGRPAIDATVKPHDPEFAKRVADAYDVMKHESETPAVKKSYQAMANEVKKQWDYATKEMGMKFEPWTKEGQPYANSKEMVNDVRDNKHLYFFQGGDIKPESPMAKVDKDTGLTYNDMFRAVHDLFGHAAHGFEFGPKGEENAYLVHRQMFPAEAIPALTSETRGQNSWVNFGKHLRGTSGEVAKKGEEGYVPPAQRPYAEQKVGLLPEEFHGQTAKPSWWNEPSENKFAKGMTKGQEVTDWLKRHNPSMEGDKYVLYHATPVEGGAKDSIRAGSLLAEDPETALHQASRERGTKSGDIKVGKVLVSPEDIRPGVWASVRNDHPVTEWSKPKPAQKFGTDWAAGVEKAPFGGVNPNNPEAPSKKYGFEIAPEHRHNPEALTAAEARAYAERPDVKAALAAHPDVKLGWDTTTQGPELNIGASTDDLDTAKKIAGKLDQRAIVNTQTGEEIPAGGEGKKTAFPEYPLADRLKDLDAGKLEKAALPTQEEVEDFFEKRNQIANEVIREYNNKDKQSWETVPAGRLKKIWNDYAKLGFVRDDVGMNLISSIVLENIHKLAVNNALTGHTEEEPSEFAEGVTGETHPDDYFYKNDNFFDDEKGIARISDYGIDKLEAGALDLMRAKTPEDKLQAVDHILNITHQRSDLPAWFVEGGTKTLNELKGRPSDVDAGRLEKAKEEPKEFAENPEGFKHVSPQVLQHLEPDEQAFIKDNKRAQAQIQKHYDEIKPTIDETKAAMQVGQALGGWWRRYIDAFNALGEHTNEEVAAKLGPKHADALKVWHAAVSGNKPVEAANRIAWGSYADWLDQGMPRDRSSINKILADNAAVTDTHWPKNSKKAGQVKREGLDTTKLFRLVNSPEMKQIDPSPWHGNVFDPNQPSPIYGVTTGARKIPSMGATVAGEGNLNRLVLDTHMLDYFGEKKWTDNRYLAFSAHIRQAARELGLQPGEGQEQIWGTVLGIKKLLYEGLPDSEIPAELTNNLIEGIGKDYAQIIKDDPELTDIFERLKAHGIDPGGNRAQARLAAILEGKRPAGKAPANQTRLAESAARIRANLKDVPPPENTLRFNFGANQLKLEQAAQKHEAVGLHEDDLPYRAKYQSVDFSAQDLQDSEKRVTPETILKDYAADLGEKGYAKDKNFSVYKSYIPMEDLPSAQFGEPEEGEEDFDPSEFDREEYRSPRVGVPIKVVVHKNGSLGILDGNHRAKVWEEQGQQYAPAWVIDRRGANIKHGTSE